MVVEPVSQLAVLPVVEPTEQSAVESVRQSAVEPAGQPAVVLSSLHVCRPPAAAITPVIHHVQHHIEMTGRPEAAK